MLRAATTQRVALQLREVAIRSKRITLRAAREAAESTGLMSGFLSLGLSLLLTPVLLLSPFSRKLQWRIFGLPLGRAVFVVYCLWVYGFDRSVCPKGGRPVRWVRFNLLTRLIRSYFRCKVTYDFGEDEAVLDRSSPYVLGIHPHGVMSLGLWTNGMFNDLLPSFPYRVVTITANMWVPFWRDILLAVGFVDSSRSTIKALLDQEISVGIVVGGADEALNARPHTADLTLETRLGFIRIALEHGAALIPVYTFGENELFQQVWPNPPKSMLRNMQDRLKKVLGYSLPIVMPGNIMAHQELHTVVGRPLLVPQIDEPTLDEVLHWHQQYVSRLQELFDKYQPTIAPETVRGIRMTDTFKSPESKL